jgi:hypothetical protein
MTANPTRYPDDVDLRHLMAAVRDMNAHHHDARTHRWPIGLNEAFSYADTGGPALLAACREMVEYYDLDIYASEPIGLADVRSALAGF